MAPTNPDTEITLRLPLGQINQILSALGKRPCEDVFDLVVSIRGQAHEQLTLLPPSASE
jgi:hypothetical protein